MRTLLLATAMLLSVGLIGCGKPPSQLEACKHFCDKQGECTKASSADINTCKNNCTAQSATWNDNDKLIENMCKNADSVKSKIYDCYGDYCDMTLAGNCADSAANTCELK